MANFTFYSSFLLNFNVYFSCWCVLLYFDCFGLYFLHFKPANFSFALLHLNAASFVLLILNFLTLKVDPQTFECLSSERLAGGLE